MKKIIYLILILLLITGCQKEAVVKEPIKEVEEPKPIIIGFEIIEKSIHNYIVAAQPEGMYLSLSIEITNAGEEAVTINTTDIKLIDNGNEYFISILYGLF